jgi:maleylpyruvate isomerase
MILYDYWRSSSAWRVRIALHFKGIPFERRVVNLIKDGGEQHANPFHALNPSRQVPVLIPDGSGRAITQSMAIIAYLEEQFPTPPLLPVDPWRRARARQLAEMVNAGIQPHQNLATLEGLKALGVDASAWARENNTRGLAALEAAAGETVGTFLVGDAASIADVYLIPQLYAARRFSVDLAPYPTLLRVEATCALLPAFVAAHPDAQTDAVPVVEPSTTPTRH